MKTIITLPSLWARWKVDLPLLRLGDIVHSDILIHKQHSNRDWELILNHQVKVLKVGISANGYQMIEGQIIGVEPKWVAVSSKTRRLRSPRFPPMDCTDFIEEEDGA